ncbi:glycosyltransferase family 4 protein [Novosphingobium tardum]|uniref:Glycosyltransferase family 4 protein n=1 Tax=Novosphingobium tardum TaxID=1538021 RepID=A0ABV8RMR3_9SPHN
MTDAFGGSGGIALYNRDVLKAMSDSPEVASVVALPRIAGPFTEPLPPRVEWREEAARGSLRYVAECMMSVIRRRPIDVIWCAHVNLLSLCAVLSRLAGARLILAIYGVEAWEPFERKSSIPALRRVDRVVSISRYTADRFREWSNFDESRISIVANAIDLSAYSDGGRDPNLVQRYDLAEREVVMILGRMHPSEGKKGFDELLEALPLIRDRRPGVLALVAGEGDDRPRLEAKAEALGIADAVRFTGQVHEAEKAAHYRLADAYVQPSRQEGFGFVHLEAMACGTPAVASIADGAREAVRDGMIGRLIDPSDPDSIVSQTILALDDARGVPEGLAHFAYPRFAGEIAAVLRGVAR